MKLNENIFIVGIPRSGKTTLCRILKQKFENSNLISTEAIRNGLQKSIPNLPWGIHTSDVRQNEFPRFVGEYIVWNEFFTKNFSIVDASLIGLNKVYTLAKSSDVIICLGFGGISNEEIWNLIKLNESVEDYTKSYSYEKILKIWGDVSHDDLDNIELCKKINIAYFDTSTNRDKIIQNIVDYIIDKNNPK